MAARQAILDDLAGGATSIWLDLGEDGLRPSDLPQVLDGVHLDLISVVLDPEPAWAESAAGALVQLGPFRGAGEGGPGGRVGPGGGGNLGLDPIGWLARTGAPIDPGPIDPGPVDLGPVDLGPIDPGPIDLGPAVAWARAMRGRAAQASPPLTVDATVYHDAGGQRRRRSWAARSRPASPTCGR